MKYSYLLLLSALFHGNLVAQNLVPNPGFEDTLGCPGSWSEIYKAKHWNQCGGSTPDFFYACAGAGTFMGVPYNFQGYQQALSGKGYAGIGCYNSYVPKDREIIVARLASPLVIGQTYFVKFSANRADDSTTNSAFVASNRIGARFRTSPCPSPANFFAPDNFAHVFTNNIITDMTSWTTVSGSFIADSAYQYIMIGNFFTNVATSIMPNNLTDFYTSYYFIDDVCVSIYAAKCNEYVGISETGEEEPFIESYPNPVMDHVKIKCAETVDCLTITGIDGAVIKNFEEIKSQEFDLDMISFDSGIYFLRVISGHRSYTKRIFKQ